MLVLWKQLPSLLVQPLMAAPRLGRHSRKGYGSRLQTRRLGSGQLHSRASCMEVIGKTCLQLRHPGLHFGKRTITKSGIRCDSDRHDPQAECRYASTTAGRSCGGAVMCFRAKNTGNLLAEIFCNCQTDENLVLKKDRVFM